MVALLIHFINFHIVYHDISRGNALHLIKADKIGTCIRLRRLGNLLTSALWRVGYVSNKYLEVGWRRQHLEPVGHRWQGLLERRHNRRLAEGGAWPVARAPSSDIPPLTGGVASGHCRQTHFAEVNNFLLNKLPIFHNNYYLNNNNNFNNKNNNFNNNITNNAG